MNRKEYRKLHPKPPKIPQGTLNIFDIDGTLFNTDAAVQIVKDGKVTRVLNHVEYNNYKLKHGEKYDFDQFRSGKLFRTTAKPLNKMLDKAKDIVASQSMADYSRSIIVTARSNFHDKDDFLEAFRDHGFPIDQVYVERSGNYEKLKANVAKGVVTRKYLNSGKYSKVVMWDDSEDNLKMFLKLSKLHPEISFEGYLVNPHTGEFRKYGQINEERLSSFIRKVAGQVFRDINKL